MANILKKKRRKVGTVCPVCQSPDYKQEPPHFLGGKPNFMRGKK